MKKRLIISMRTDEEMAFKNKFLTEETEWFSIDTWKKVVKYHEECTGNCGETSCSFCIQSKSLTEEMSKYLEDLGFTLNIHDELEEENNE